MLRRRRYITKPGVAQRTPGAKRQRQTGLVQNDHRVDWTEAFQLFSGDVAYIWHAGLYAGVVASSLQSCGFEIRSQIIWDKTRLIISRGDYHFQHEPCWYAVRKGKTGHWAGDRKQTTVWNIACLHKDLIEIASHRSCCRRIRVVDPK